MRVALTGVTGHLGAAVLKELAERGFRVHLLVRRTDEHRYSGYPVSVFQGDLLKPESLVPFLEGCDALIHSAAAISIDGDKDGMVTKTNVDGTRHIMEAARRAGLSRVVHVSSIHVYDQNPIDKLLDETRQYIGADGYAYSRSKREGQKLALSMSDDRFEVVSMNPTAIIGPYDYKPSRMGRVIIDLVSRSQNFITQGGFDFCDVRDVAKAVVNGLNTGKAGEAYLLSGRWHSLLEIASELNTLGHRVRTFIVPSGLAYAGVPFARLVGWISGREPVFTQEALSAVFEGNRHISSDKAKRELDYHARPLRETLKDTIDWFHEAGYF